MTQLQAYKTNKDIPQDALLGFLSFNHLDKDIRITKDDLRSKFEREGLQEYTPELEVRDHDVFRRATSGYQNHVLLENRQEKHKLMIRETGANNDEITRSLVRETLVKGTEPNYEVVGHIKLMRDTGATTHSVMNGNNDVESVIQQMIHDYADLREFHNKDSVSNIINRITNRLRPVSVIPNGRAKFVPSEYSSTLYSLQNVIRDLNSSSELIPLIDTEDQRDLVNKGIQKQTENDLNTLIYEISQILNGKADMTARKYKSFQKRMESLEDTVSYYEKILSRKSLVHKGIKQLKNQLMVVNFDD